MSVIKCKSQKEEKLAEDEIISLKSNQINTFFYFLMIIYSILRFSNNLPSNLSDSICDNIFDNFSKELLDILFYCPFNNLSENSLIGKY